MNQTTTGAVVARRRRLHQIRVRVAAGAAALFVGVFSLIATQQHGTPSTTTSAHLSSPTSVTTSQS